MSLKIDWQKFVDITENKSSDYFTDDDELSNRHR